MFCVVVDFTGLEYTVASVESRFCRRRSSDIPAANVLSCKSVVGTIAKPDDLVGLDEGDRECELSLREAEVSVCVTLALGATMGECGLEEWASRLGCCCTSSFIGLDVRWGQLMARVTFFCDSDGEDPSSLKTEDLFILWVVSCKDTCNTMFW